MSVTRWVAISSARDLDINPEMLLKGVQDALAGNEPLHDPAGDAYHPGGSAEDGRCRPRAEDKGRGREEPGRRQGIPGRECEEGGCKDPAERPAVQGHQGRLRGQPKPADTVTVHYRGTLIDGTEFDSSYSRGKPATFGVDRVIAGWTEALQLMKEGAKWQLFIPPELAYGDKRTGNIEPNSTLIFEVELISVN